MSLAAASAQMMRRPAAAKVARKTTLKRAPNVRQCNRRRAAQALNASAAALDLDLPPLDKRAVDMRLLSRTLRACVEQAVP